jgi:hypothetical protein
MSLNIELAVMRRHLKFTAWRNFALRTDINVGPWCVTKRHVLFNWDNHQKEQIKKQAPKCLSKAWAGANRLNAQENFKVSFFCVDCGLEQKATQYCQAPGLQPGDFTNTCHSTHQAPVPQHVHRPAQQKTNQYQRC